MNVKPYPLSWPPGRVRRKYPTTSRFGKSVTFARARDTLIDEICRLGGFKVTLSTNVPLKLDGMPYGTYATPADKGVAVYFEFKKRPMAFACDEWDRIEHNVWAIAKTIEALRGIERWGPGWMMEQAFSGFTALPAPETKKHWKEVLGFMGTADVTIGTNAVRLRRSELLKQHHPDVGGSAEKAAEINRAFDDAMKELK